MVMETVHYSAHRMIDDADCNEKRTRQQTNETNSDRAARNRQYHANTAVLFSAVSLLETDAYKSLRFVRHSVFLDTDKYILFSL